MRTKILELRKRPGITLIELLIYLAITMIVLVVIIDLVTRVAQTKKQSKGEQEITAQARFLSERLSYAIQSASAVSGTYPANDLDLTVNASDVIFTLANGQFFYQEGSATPIPLTNNKVEIFGTNIFQKMTNGSATSIQIHFSVRFKENNLTRDFQTTVLERGK